MAAIQWGERAGIRPMRPGDASALRRYMTDQEIAHLLFEEQSDPMPSSLTLALWILFSDGASRTEFAIVDEQERFIGSVRLWRISERNRSCMLTIFIGERSYWGKGYGTDALRLALRHAFGPLGLHRVELHVFEFNQRAVRSYEKVGFVHEGVRREALMRKGQYYDIYVMGITQQEFAQKEAERQSIAPRREDSQGAG